jgi:hypothetical protein
MSQAPLVLVGTIANFAENPHPDESIGWAEQEGPFIVADARDAGRWLGLGFGGRWKTWVLGDLANLPMQWPKFNRFHENEQEAEVACDALRGAIQRSMQGAPIKVSPKKGDAPTSRYELIFPNGPGGEQAGAIGILMKDWCSDYDFAMHMTRGLACLRGGNYDGPRMISYRPPPFPCTVAVGMGPNNRADHVVIVFSPGETDQSAFIAGGMQGAAPDGQHVDVTIDVPSGVLVGFWSRLDGRQVMGRWGNDPAMGLATGPLARAVATPIPTDHEGFEARQRGPAAWAFLVNPGKWTARYAYTDTPDGAGLSCCVMSREGAAPFNTAITPVAAVPGLQPGMPANPMEATKNAFQQVAKDKLNREADRMYEEYIGRYMPSAVMRRFRTGLENRFWAVVSGCVFTIVAVLIIGVTLGATALLVAWKIVMG